MGGGGARDRDVTLETERGVTLVKDERERPGVGKLSVLVRVRTCMCVCAEVMMSRGRRNGVRCVGQSGVLGCARGAHKVEVLTSRVGEGGASNAGSGS